MQTNNWQLKIKSHWTWLGLGTLALITIVGPKNTPAADDAAKAAGAQATLETTLKAANALYDGIREETLPNGLRVFLKPIPGSPVVTTMVAYQVGSADEDLDNTGLSHYLEHLMFKGTEKLMPGDIDHATLINGGQNNAYTSTDYTIFHFDFAADRWDRALEVEADRMQNLRIDDRHEFQKEKGAVCNELRRDEDQPWDLEQKAILPLLFGPTDPYGHPVIGQEVHVRAATAEIIKAHYDKWYHPNNAALVICGGFDPDKALARIKELFGPIPKADLPPRKKTVPIEHKTPVHFEFASKFDLPRMLMGFNGVDNNDPDMPALEMAQAILSGGKTSRFYKHLIEGAQIATGADASDQPGRYPGWFSVQLELLPDKDRAKAEELVLAELKKLADEPVSAEELQRVRNQLVAGAVFDREGVHQLADNIAQGVSNNKLEWVTTMLPRMVAVTPEDIQRVAKKYLDPQHRVVVWSVPKPQKEDVPAAGGGKGDGAKPGEAKGPTPKQRHADSAPGAAGTPSGVDFSLKPARRVVLPNGLVLLLWENHRLPIVVAEADVKDVFLREPADKSGLAALMGSLLDEGTTAHTGPQISEIIENVGGALSLGSSGGSVKVLAKDRSLGLGLLFECMMGANFPDKAFARDQDRQLAAIDDAEHEPTDRASKLFSKLVYGDHPLGRPGMGTHKSVEKLTPADCAAFHSQVFVPNNTIMSIAGDFDPDEVVAEVKRLTADWKSTPLPELKLPEVEKPKEFTERIIPMPEAAQLQFFMGHVGIRRDNPDYYKLVVMDRVLGTGTGFTDRLSSRLRDREGLAYTVTANIFVGRRAARRVHLLHRHRGSESGPREEGVSRRAKPHPRQAADGARGRRREEMPARRTAVRVRDQRANRRPLALGRAPPPRLRLPGRLPPQHFSRYARRRAGGGPQVSRSGAHGAGGGRSGG